MSLRARICLWGSAAMLAAAALLPAVATGATTAHPAAVDLNAPVKSGAQCMPCHANIGAAKKPGLIFSHASHIVYSCDGCHTAPAHTGGANITPDMASCFNCHGLKHKGKEIARSSCATCHTKDWPLRPRDHTPDYKGKPHVAPSRADTNACLLCHTAKSCDDCHAKTAPAAPKTQPEYRPVLKGAPRAAAIRVYPDGLVTIGQCVNCHPDIDKFLPGRVIFAHATHLQKAFACKDCHRAFPHGPDQTTRPDMPSCYQCHGLVHAARGLVATEKCADCHPKSFQLKPADHTAAFVKSRHKDASNKAPETCSMCHQPAFCTACHRGDPKEPGGPRRPPVIPADHKKATFRKIHGVNFLKQRGACGSCHDSASCEKCHKTPMPHPADWTSTHALVRNLDSQDCNVCHIDRQRCQECHHQNQRGNLLVRENCVKCHPEMRIKPATSIKNKGLAEHAVHFDVGKKKGREAYRCEECHVGFGLSAVSSHDAGAKLNQGHDLRLCYECHGALDYQNIQIAPYPGQALCLRCHTNLNL
ncbi:MAG: cytochrome c3 family protein [Coriobacteriia bacterium]|nr:cytochrome c3 family protein [Coriobacteriia bacterium]